MVFCFLNVGLKFDKSCLNTLYVLWCPRVSGGELYYSNGSGGVYCIHTNVYTGEGYMVPQGEALVWQQQQTQTRQKNDSKNGCSPAKLS